MGSLPPPPVKLSLDVTPTFVPNTIGGFLREVAAIGDASRRSSRLEDLVSSLEEELRKIDAFKRELPLCMLLMQDAIITLKLELVQCTAARSDCQPMQLAELMPLKKGSDEVEIERCDEDDKEKDDAKDKRNWKSCLQLWNSSTSFNSNDSPTAARSFDLKEDRKADSTKGNDELEKNQETASEEDVLRKNGNRVSDFMPIFPRKEKEAGLELPLSLLTSSGGSKKNCSSSMEKTEKRPSSSNIRRPISLNFQSSSRNSGEQQQQQNSRKQRRCWSPELHRRFISALQQLGGSQVATPKQIRELMQVDGLTNDEVKSHLQKYRLHTRRFPVASAANEAKNQSNQSQFVLGGLWPSSSQDKTDESAKGNNNNDSSGSPEGPLQLCLSAGAAASATGGADSNSMEDDEDSKSRSFTWGKNHIHRPRTIGV